MAKQSRAEQILTPARLKKLQDMKRQGATVEELMGELRIKSKDTFYKWVKRYPKLRKAIEDGEDAQARDLNAGIQAALKDKMPELVEAFVKLLMGGKDVESKLEKIETESGEIVGNVKKSYITKTLQPNATIWIFLLKCMFGWSEKSVVEVQGQPNNVMGELTLAELRKLVNIYGKDKH